MKLTDILNGTYNAAEWEQKGYQLPKFDIKALREKTAKLWSEMNHVTILPEQINCEGCRANGAKTVYCEQLCGIRQCAMKKGFETCGDCPELDTCQTVAMVIGNNPDARKNLKG